MTFVASYREQDSTFWAASPFDFACTFSLEFMGNQYLFQWEKQIRICGIAQLPTMNGRKT
jgi:hypothetical protein